ncbi:MAG TPA: M20 family metallopeptidase [Candidatus Xenobia bacterium]|jgi:acetylornithine deacetylase/succinyl-diaminopimelate desuccinylase-like protein
MPTDTRTLDPEAATRFVTAAWDESIVPTLTEYVKIPNKSETFDPDWRANGHMDRAADLIADWCRKNAVKGMKLEVIRHPQRSPLIFMDIPGQADHTVMLYGHLDKQPEMSGWADGLGPWTPVMKGDRLYGRGSADDGYAAFASLTAVRALEDQGVPHARCVILIEAGEESGSPDLPAYIEDLRDRIGVPRLIICLDSGCANYDQLWLTTSLRGVVSGTLTVSILKEGVHSGDAGGIVPSSFRIARELISRIEDEKSGDVLVPECHAKIPADRQKQAEACAQALGATALKPFPFVEGAVSMGSDPVELLLNRTWRPALAVTGAEGLPPAANAGNVLRPFTTLKLSMRLPPTCHPQRALDAIQAKLLDSPPYGAHVTFDGDAAGGWNAPPLAPWLEKSIGAASRRYFGQDWMAMGEGGSIPFMAMLGMRFPNAQFLITGVLGPGSNAHGPNEFLDVPTGKKLTCAVAHVLADEFHQA